jgi:diacylglycerol kinase (ATP)
MKTSSFYSITRLMKAFKYSVDGLVSAFKSEAAFRLELFLLIILLPVAFIVEATVIEKVLLVSSLVLVLIVELINTAIEAVVDRVSLEKHELSKKAKDVGSSAVLIAALNAAFVWGAILL